MNQDIATSNPAAPDGAWPYPRLVAHRCGGTLAPENTLAGFDACGHYGYRMVEFDAKLSADDVAYLLHDDTLDRTTDGSGEAALYAWPQLAALDAGSWRDPRFAGERLPTLAQVAGRCARDGIAANIEIKPCPGTDVRTGNLVALAAEALWRDHPVAPLLSSFSVDALAAARDAAPSVARGMLFTQLPDDWLATARALRCVSIHASHRYLTEAQVRAIHDAGLRVLVYTVNDAALAQKLGAWGVDAICTDRLDLLPHDMFEASESGA